MSEAQKETLALVLRSGLTEDFYLTGGTALLLKYDHRISEDLDFFTFPEKAEGNFPSEKLFRFFQNYGTLLDHRAGTSTGLIKGIKVSFSSYPYPLLRPPKEITVEGGRLFLASDEDLAATKMIAIAQRGCKKDFFDLYFLMTKHGWDWETAMNFCLDKFSLSQEQIGFLLKGLVYFSDAERDSLWISEDMPLRNEQWEEIKEFFRRGIRGLVERKVRE
ncbi:nucleotidyl transferase AbiEii/AbiGii toxin family protein [Thermosulfurimonas sp. F29]|uniref:nucleotidyl transferase AbiEii/AbiGii toxin family protein n=1 Tax=Thermosulfurimonas sp. F29 TaxID=2867247 RepID=UPI001C830B32|nr:nucleotidyl transferase AbiEii/AbiGii toxin family protein [Thermosulfurimonas sp. F29]MBX6422069.1 nucleotidyl transferase AbiEii/AbiGii toxin family protein [Thermosulfurimonas sp. F29]